MLYNEPYFNLYDNKFWCDRCEESVGTTLPISSEEFSEAYRAFRSSHRCCALSEGKVSPSHDGFSAQTPVKWSRVGGL